jgi:hypothetical protein
MSIDILSFDILSFDILSFGIPGVDQNTRRHNLRGGCELFFSSGINFNCSDNNGPTHGAIQLRTYARSWRARQLINMFCGGPNFLRIKYNASVSGLFWLLKCTNAVDFVTTKISKLGKSYIEGVFTRNRSFVLCEWFFVAQPKRSLSICVVRPDFVSHNQTLCRTTHHSCFV